MAEILVLQYDVPVRQGDKKPSDADFRIRLAESDLHQRGFSRCKDAGFRHQVGNPQEHCVVIDAHRDFPPADSDPHGHPVVRLRSGQRVRRNLISVRVSEGDGRGEIPVGKPAVSGIVAELADQDVAVGRGNAEFDKIVLVPGGEHNTDAVPFGQADFCLDPVAGAGRRIDTAVRRADPLCAVPDGGAGAAQTGFEGSRGAGKGTAGVGDAGHFPVIDGAGLQHGPLVAQGHLGIGFCAAVPERIQKLLIPRDNHLAGGLADAVCVGLELPAKKRSRMIQPHRIFQRVCAETDCFCIRHKELPLRMHQT